MAARWLHVGAVHARSRGQVWGGKQSTCSWCLNVVKGFVVVILAQPSSLVVLVLVCEVGCDGRRAQSNGTLLHKTARVRVACLASGVGQLALREENGLLETFPSMCGSSTPAPSCQEEEDGERRREEEGEGRTREEEEERKRREEEEKKPERRRGGGKGGEKKRRREAARSRSSGGRIQKITREPSRVRTVRTRDYSAAGPPAAGV